MRSLEPTHRSPVELLEPGRLLGFVAAIALAATVVPPPVASADPVPIYGGPTYSTSAGGYRAEIPPLRFLWSAHVNDAGTAVATVWKSSSSGDLLGTRAVRWSPSSSATELEGDPNSIRVDGINAGGTVIGTAVAAFDVNEFYAGHPARWVPSAAAATILQHPPVVGSPNGYGSPFLYDQNDAGTAVGTVYETARDQSGVPVDLGTRPGRWDSSGTTLTELGLLRANLAGFQAGEARAINAAGVAVGYSGISSPDGADAGWRAVRWNASGVAATELGTLGTTSHYGSYPDGWTESEAFAINRAGTAVGYANVYDDSGQLLRQHAPVRWDASGAATELGNLGGGDTTVQGSHALNDAGTVVGWSDKDDDTGAYRGQRAVRWDASGTAAIELGNLGGTDANGFTFSEAWAVNGSGTAVGWAWKVNAAGMGLGERAVYWGADTTAVDLNTLIDPSSGWLLTRALEISDTGWIVGEGQFDPDGPGGQAAYYRNFLMQVPATVPEPTTLVLVLSAGLFAWRRQGIS